MTFIPVVAVNCCAGAGDGDSDKIERTSIACC